MMALLEKAEFEKQNPGGKYIRYLRYVAKKGGPQMSAAAKAKLKKLGKGGGGGGGSQGAGAQPWVEPYTLTQIQALAQQLTQAALLPQQQAIDLAQQEYMAQAAAQQAAIQSYSQQAATQLEGIGPRVQGVYQDAAGAQAGFAKGFSDGLRQLAEQQAAEQAAILERQGAPAAQIAQVQGLSGDAGSGDVLYGLGGYLPAASLGREGAAWASAASMLPQQALAQGQEGLRAAQWEAAQQGKQFRAQLADLAAQAPGIYQQTMQQLLGNEREKWAARLAAQQFQADVGQQQWENQFDVATAASDAAAAQAGALADAEKEAAKAAAARKKARAAYITDISENIPRLYQDYLDQLQNNGDDTGGGLNAPPGGGAGGKTPTKTGAMTFIYGTLKTTHTTGKGKWRYRVNDKLVRRKIEEYLTGILGGAAAGGAAGGPPTDMSALLDPNQYLAP